MTIHERFPEPYVLTTFAVSVVGCLIGAVILAAMVVDLAARWRWPYRPLRIGTVVLFAGTLTWRLYATWALWRFHWANLPRERVVADLAEVIGMLVFVGCWLWHVRHRPKVGGGTAR